MMTALAACSGSSGSGAGASSSNNYSRNSSSEVSEADIEQLAVSALYLEILDIANASGNNKDLDPGATRYSITKIEKQSNGDYFVYGNGSFYDKYGRAANPYSKNRNEFRFNFTVRMYNNFKNNYCTIEMLSNN